MYARTYVCMYVCLCIGMFLVSLRVYACKYEIQDPQPRLLYAYMKYVCVYIYSAIYLSIHLKLSH